MNDGGDAGSEEGGGHQWLLTGMQGVRGQLGKDDGEGLVCWVG